MMPFFTLWQGLTDRPARFTVNFNAPSLNPQWSVRHCKGAAGLVTVWCNSCHLLRPMVEKTKLTKIEQSLEIFLIHFIKKIKNKTKIQLNFHNEFIQDNLLASQNVKLWYWRLVCLDQERALSHLSMQQKPWAQDAFQC